MNVSERHPIKDEDGPLNEEDGRTSPLWTTVQASGTGLDPWLSSSATRALMYAGTGKDVEILASQFGAKELKAVREQHMAALIIQSRGNKVLGSCVTCDREGPGPFRACVRTRKHFGGACASCVFKDEGNRCSHTIPWDWFPMDRPRTRQYISDLPPMKGNPEVLELTKPEVIDLETWIPSERTPTNSDATAAPALHRTPINFENTPRALAYNEYHEHQGLRDERAEGL